MHACMRTDRYMGIFLKENGSNRRPRSMAKAKANHDSIMVIYRNLNIPTPRPRRGNEKISTFDSAWLAWFACLSKTKASLVFFGFFFFSSPHKQSTWESKNRQVLTIP
jgi:hypothetical protein